MLVLARRRSAHGFAHPTERRTNTFYFVEYATEKKQKADDTDKDDV